MALNSGPDIKVSRELARNILNNDQRYVPAPLESEDLKVWAESWSDILLENRENEEQIKTNENHIVVYPA